MNHYGLAAWSNDHFQKKLYPLRTPAKEQLPRYQEAFTAVEVSRFFHNTPPQEEMQSWREQAPKLQFLAKAPRTVTHARKTTETTETWKQFQNEIACLRPAAYLLQFQSNFRNKPENLAWLEEVLTPNTAVEFRHDSWFTNETKQLLEEKQACLAWSTYPGAIAPHWKTTNWGYIRLGGNNVPPRGQKPDFKTRTDHESMQPDWDTCYIIATNPYEGDALQTIVRASKHFGDEIDLSKTRRDASQPGLF